LGLGTTVYWSITFCLTTEIIAYTTYACINLDLCTKSHCKVWQLSSRSSSS
jgi:hypothetical protein